MTVVTDYKSLSEIDENIRQWYKEEVRERVVGHKDEGGLTTPIYEPYTVIVLDKPDEVSYSDVLQRRAENKDWETVVKLELTRAIAWEEFVILHDGYLMWKSAHAEWEETQPTEVVYDPETNESSEVVVPAPTAPTVDISVRRETYEVARIYLDTNYFINTGEVEVTYDDVTYIRTDRMLGDPRSEEYIAKMHKEQAIQLRFDTIHGLLEYNGHQYQMDKGKDGVYGIANFKDVITAVTVDPSKEADIVYWITADNDVVPLTYQDVKNIVGLFHTRQQETYLLYGQWTGGDMQQAFSLLAK